jgi:ABC-type nickel/cobalt efflux system permease component RcnA
MDDVDAQWDAIRSHLPPEDTALSFRSLLARGITGGALPCPSALVVMLGAIALHRVAFGLALIVCFSLGLAAILTAIGLLVVYARRFLDRLPLNNAAVAHLPVFSAAIVTMLGFFILVRAFTGAF